MMSKRQMAKLDPTRILNINLGILGHVDSGKTSLVKALSELLSTASLDKSKQSKERGITLDLGFSAFMMPLPEAMIANLKERDGGGEDWKPPFDMLQITLVDCPGHASLIKTIIGGAQIIDMIVLVVDVNKGLQTQTAECLVIGEITCDQMIIALNKVDQIPEEQRELAVKKMTATIRRQMAGSKFVDVTMVPVSAKIGGEKVVAVGGKVEVVEQAGADQAIGALKTAEEETLGLDQLLETVKNELKCPVRDPAGPFLLAVDHCFPIKGQGTVLTGTVLGGALGIGEMLELPALGQQKKIKSMQMFHRPAQRCQQGAYHHLYHSVIISSDIRCVEARIRSVVSRLDHVGVVRLRCRVCTHAACVRAL
jgi:selenocysteine-specific elongation factor